MLHVYDELYILIPENNVWREAHEIIFGDEVKVFLENKALKTAGWWLKH